MAEYNKRKNQMNELIMDREQERKERRTRALLAADLVIFVLCVMVVGVLYIVKYAPDHLFVTLRDTEAPVVQVHDLTVVNSDLPDIGDFVDKVEDDTNVTISWETAPVDGIEGEQQLTILFRDEAGNVTRENVVLSIIRDFEAPVILCDDDIYVALDESISYKSYVTLQDNKDSSVELIVDSNVDITEIGDYTVTYTARDDAGNASSKVVTFHVLATDSAAWLQQEADELCDLIISQIITDDMDALHQVWAVYEYVRSIPYVLTDYTDDYVYEGWKILSTYSGDCYGSYSAVRLLLERLGISCIPVTTDRTYTGPHFWNLVSVDGGISWYHVDATNWSEWDQKPVMCMISDARLDEISVFHLGTHIFDHTIYPSTPYESMAVPEDIVQKYSVTDRLY